MKRLLAALSTGLCTGPACAELPVLEFPLGCELGDNCFIQQYVDRDPGPDASDFRCRGLTYDTHRGTDFRIAFRRDIHNPGVAVLSASPGKVRAVRDSMEDIAQGSAHAPEVKGKECGNGIVIEHAGGWATQYCHLRKGSIAVHKDQQVKAGQFIGRLGLSGMTEFPHLHFKLTLNDIVVDPFDLGDRADCAASSSLWAAPIAYTPGGVLAAGFSDRALNFDEIREGPKLPVELAADVEAMVFWVYAYGLEVDDEIDISILDPSGQEFVRKVYKLERDRAEAFRLVGKSRRDEPFLPGQYLGQATIFRGGEILDQTNQTLEIN